MTSTGGYGPEAAIGGAVIMCALLRLTALRRSRAGTADASGGGDEVTDLGGGALVRVQSLCPRAELAHLG